MNQSSLALVEVEFGWWVPWIKSYNALKVFGLKVKVQGALPMFENWTQMQEALMNSLEKSASNMDQTPCLGHL